MKMRPLGKSGIEVSEVGLGTWALAGRAYGDVDPGAGKETIRAALDQGVTLFDTAPLYGDAQEEGISERVLGTALGADRDRVLISTKFGRSSARKGTWFSASGVETSVESSLQRLRTDRIDLLFFHSPFGAEEIEDDVWEALSRLKASGKIRCVGHSISKFADTEGMARTWAGERRIDAIQVVYSLMNREAADLIVDLGQQGIGVVGRESLANGFLSGRITRDTVFPANNLNRRYSREEVEDRVGYVEQLGFLVRDDVTTMPQAALRWVLEEAAVSSVLSGAAKSPAELADAVQASACRGFTQEELRRADVIHEKDYEAA